MSTADSIFTMAILCMSLFGVNIVDFLQIHAYVHINIYMHILYSSKRNLSSFNYFISTFTLLNSLLSLNSLVLAAIHII